MATIMGTAGNDSLQGTIGDDLIITGGGVDAVDGSAGDDVVRFTGSAPSGNQTVGIIDGGTGHDTLDLTQWQGALQDHDVGGFLGFLEVGSDGQTNWIGYVRNFEEVHLGTGVLSFSAYQESVDNPATIVAWTIVGSDAADNITDSRAYDHVSSGAGNDVIHYMGGSNQDSLGAGDDFYSVEKLTGYPDHVTIDGGGGTDTIDILQTALGRHIAFDLATGTGQDGTTSFTLTSMENAIVDTLDGPVQAGRTIDLAGDNGANTLTATGQAETTLLGRGGDDMLNGINLKGAVTAYGGSGTDTIWGGDQADWLNGGGHYAGDAVPADTLDDGGDYIDGGGGNDHIYGNSQIAIQGAADGADFIHGGDGSDYVNGNAGNDTIYGDAGTDRLYGGSGNDVIDGGTGDDHINGNKGNDDIRGGDGNDQLLGGQGNDWLTGGNGFDTLTGNAGNDTFFVADSGHFSASGPDAGHTDVITDFQDGQDKISLNAGLTAVLHPGTANDFAGAVAMADTALATASTTDIAAVQVGADTYVFYGAVDHVPQSAVHLLNVSATTLTTADFL